jgi:alpha-L-fucosidase
MDWGFVRVLLVSACAASAWCASAQPDSAADQHSAAARARRIAWFDEAKFGLFVHWGPFSLQGSDPNATFDYFDMKGNAALRMDYTKYAKAFDPKKFDAGKWMAAANSAGMKYVVFTSKHHDGYCLFDSALTDYDSIDGLPKADYVRELVRAARTAQLKIGFYYSILDWYQPDYSSDFPKYVSEYLFPQVKELCANYGPIDCVWFDGEWDHPLADWRSPELVMMIRDLQPYTLINDRLGLGERGVTPLCDFYTREQPSEMNVAMAFERQRPYSWEACMTMGESWQYSLKDTKLKSTADLVRILVDVVSRGGNLLLNVGPTPDGEIPDPLCERLRGIGVWLAAHGESIYDTTRSPFASLPAGKCTAKGNRLYVHMESPPDGPLTLPGLRNAIRKAYLLDTGAELAFDNAAKTVTMPERFPNDIMTVIVIELDGSPVVE